MAQNVGSLSVSLEANLAKFQSDMGRAAAIAEQQARAIDRSLGIVKTGLASVGISLAAIASFGALKDKIEGVIASAAGLQQLSDRTGATVEALSGLAAVAKLSDTSTDSMAVGLQKLSKSMIDAENGGQKTSASFAAIGISVKDLQGKRPDQVFKTVSDALAGYQDGAEKVVIAQNLLGKSGADLLPLMKDLADVGELQVKVTAEQAAMADEYEKNLKRLQASTDAIFKKIGLELVPVFNAFTKALLETTNANDGIRKSVDDLAKDGSIREWAENAAKAAGLVIDAFDAVGRIIQIAGKGLGATAAAAVAVAHGEFSQAAQIQKAYFADVDQILSRQQFSERLNKQLADLKTAGGKAAAPEKKRIDTSGLGNANQGPQDDPARKVMEGRLRAQEALIAAERTQLASRERMVDQFRTLDYMTLRDAETKKQELAADSLAKQLDAYDKETAAAQAYLAQASKLSDQQDARNRIADIASKRAAAELAANDQIVQSQLRLLAVQRQFDLATAERARQDAIANQTGQFQLAMMGQSTLEVQKATAARQIQLALDERIYQLKKLDQNADTSAAVAQAAVQTAQATALIEAQYNKQRDAIFGAHEALRKYVEDAGDKANQIESAMTNAFKGMEDALVTFVTTGKLSFKSLVDSIVADITRMVIKEQLSKIIGGAGGSGGGIGGMLGSLLGGLFGGGAGAGAGLASATAADVAAAGPGLMFFANGGSPPLNVPSVVGEDGPELFVPRQAGTIIPNGALAGAGGNTVNVTVNQSFPPGTSRATTQQAAAEARRQLEYSARNL